MSDIREFLEPSGLGEIVFDEPVGWFVYVGDGKHRWRFVRYGFYRYGQEAIDAAETEARAMENAPGESYMAAPAPALCTRGKS